MRLFGQSHYNLIYRRKKKMRKIAAQAVIFRILTFRNRDFTARFYVLIRNISSQKVRRSSLADGSRDFRRSGC